MSWKCLGRAGAGPESWGRCRSRNRRSLCEGISFLAMSKFGAECEQLRRNCSAPGVDDGNADVRIGMPVPSGSSGGALGASAVPLEFAQARADAGASGSVAAPGSVPDAAAVPSSAAVLARDALATQGARIFALERENMALQQQLSRTNLQASSAADPPPTCARGSVATHGALLIENAALKRQLSSAEWGRGIYRDRASALEEEVAALKSANTELHSANAQLQGRCDRYKDHLWAANWSAGVCRENYKRLSRSWQSDHRNNVRKFARLQNDADAATRQTAEMANINSELRRRDEQLRDERDALQNALLQTQCGQARRAVERARERATSEPMHPLEAAMP